MDWKKKISSLLLLFICWFSNPLWSQGEDEGKSISTYMESDAPQPKMSASDWEKAVNGVDFGKAKAPKEEEPEEEEEAQEEIDYDDSNFDWSFGLNKTVASFILGFIILAIVILIVVLIVRQVKQSDVRVQPKSDDDSYNIEDIEENLPESDLQRYLRLALEAEDYKAAIRIYYLAIIQSLSQKKQINWQREKTNYDYLLEVSGKPIFTPFSNLTLTYELVWYGDALVSKTVYQSVEPKFSQVLKHIEDEH